MFYKCDFSNYTYEEIQTLLKLDKNVNISHRQLKRHLKRLGLKRRCTNVNSQELIAALQLEIGGSGSDLGCRAMRHRLLARHGLSVGSCHFSQPVIHVKFSDMSVVQGLPPTYSEAQVLTKLNAVSTETETASTEKVGTITIQEINDAQHDNEKRAIYSHPLFPLLTLLFEKCEQASQTAECPSADGFAVDIQTFVHHQEKANKPFFSDDPELDNLMVKAIQVLRIHLLELEKVNELCKDFCNRYIGCLKGKLQSEQLLRVDTEFDDLEMGSPPSSGGQVQGGVNSVTPGVVIQQPSVNVGTLNQVYQMVQTPQGIVAQPIQIQTAPVQTQISTGSLIHGTTPMSQIGMVSQIASSNTPIAPAATLSNSLMDDSDEDDGSGKKKNKRGVLPKQATQIMKTWLFQHIVHPYPTEDEKRQIASQTNLTLLQVNNWFINARRRILQPMLDATNPEPTKKAKSKPQNRPLQRFWPESIANLQPQIPPGLMSTAKSDSGAKVSESTTTIQSTPLVVPVVTLPLQNETKSTKENVVSDTNTASTEYVEEDLHEEPQTPR